MDFSDIQHENLRPAHIANCDEVRRPLIAFTATADH
jgi:hypothetical protein